MELKKIERNCGIDLLKVLLALMVVGLHFNARATGGVAVAVSERPFTYLVSIMVALCYPAVNTYVLISGYYSFKYKKSYAAILYSLVRLWLCLVTYSVAGYIIVTIVNNENISYYNLILRFFPLSRDVWWFMTNYFVMMMLSPMINSIIDSHSRRENFYTLLVAIVVCSVIPFFSQWEDGIGVHYGYSLVWFVVLYYTGAMLHFIKSPFSTGILLGMYLAATASFIIINYICGYLPFMEGYHVSMYNSLIVYLQAIFLFLAFLGLRIEYNHLRTAITFLSGLSLSVYIFHCQEDIGDFIWSTLKPSQFANSWAIIPLFVVTVLGIYIISISVELIRKGIGSFRNLETRLINVIRNRLLTMFRGENTNS